MPDRLNLTTGVPAPHLSPADERAAFEAWAGPRFGKGMLGRASNGPYLWDVVGDAWRVWQAARASLGQQAPTAQPAESKLRALYVHWNEFGPAHGFGELIDRMQGDSEAQPAQADPEHWAKLRALGWAPTDCRVCGEVALAMPAQAAVQAEVVEREGLPVLQEPKYTINGTHIINRASGEHIPHDEPIFIFRARDRVAAGILIDYAARCADVTHARAVEGRISDFQYFATSHPERMKWPDTTAAHAPPQAAPQPTAQADRLVDEIAALRNVCQRVKDHKDFDAAWKYHMGRLEDHENEEEPS